MKSLSWKNSESTDAIVMVNKLLKFMAANGSFKNDGGFADEDDQRNFMSGFKNDYIIPIETIERKGRNNTLMQLNGVVSDVFAKAEEYLTSMPFSHISRLSKMWPIENLRESDNKYTVMLAINFVDVPEILYTISESGISDLPADFSEHDMAEIDSFSNSIDEMISYIDKELSSELKKVIEEVIVSSLKFNKE